MSNQDMINEFLKHNEVTKCDTEGLEYSSNAMNRTKSHRTAYDYKLEPIWDGLEVMDNESGKILQFNTYVSRNQIKMGNKKKEMGATILYTINLGCGGTIRENTISERIESKRYTITKKVKD